MEQLPYERLSVALAALATAEETQIGRLFVDSCIDQLAKGRLDPVLLRTAL